MSEFIWSEKYRPRKVSQCILTPELEKEFQSYVEDGPPNLLIAGSQGIGKTTVAKAMLDEGDFDYILINGSLDGNIDTLRVKIQQYATSMSFNGKRKYVILDEGDHLTSAVQPALRSFIEQYSEHCGFIITCNYPHKIIEPLHSRFSFVDFNIPAKQKTNLAKKFFKRIQKILENESVEYDKAAVVKVVTRFYPDCRKIINELQRYSSMTNNVIDAGVMTMIEGEDVDALIECIRTKDFKGARKWIALNGDTNNVFRKLYDVLESRVEEKSIPQVIITLAQYQHWATTCTDFEVNLAACAAELMFDEDIQWI